MFLLLGIKLVDSFGWIIIVLKSLSIDVKNKTKLCIVSLVGLLKLVVNGKLYVLVK